MAFDFPSTLANLLTGPARLLWALDTVTRPTKLDDIIDMETPYAPKTGWNDFGSTTDASGYGRDLDEEEYEIEQRTGAVLTKISSVTRTLTLPVAEITADSQKIIEAAPAPVTIAEGAAASGTPAQTAIELGSITSLPKYRVAMIAERDKGLGSSGEAGVRGKLVGVVLYYVSIAAESSEFEVGRGELVAREVAFRAFPDPAVADATKAHGRILLETGATVP